MELPRVLHLIEPDAGAFARAAGLLWANGRTLPVFMGSRPRGGLLPPLSRRVPDLPAALAGRALLLAGVRIVHAHDLPQAARAGELAASIRRPWSVVVGPGDALSAALVAGASLVVVPDQAALVAAQESGVPREILIAHGLGSTPEPGALMAVLEVHWISVLRHGHPASIAVAPRALPTVTVLLATYQRRDLLRQCLEHLAAQRYPKELVQVVVVDNGSSDGSAADLKDLADKGQITLVTTGEPMLVTEARNRALGAATGELIVFTDDDCRAVPDWLSNLVEAWMVAGRGIVQGRTTGDPGQPRHAMSRTQETPFGFGLFETCNIAYPRADLGERPFDDGIPERLREILGRKFPRDPTGEDTDLGWRLREAGVPFCFTATALVHHEVFDPDPQYLLRRARMTAVFPVLVERHQELRRAFLVGRVFLHAQRPHWWLAAATPVAVAIWGPPALAAAVPYGWTLLQPRTKGVRARVRALPTTVRVDALTSLALVRGSWRTRTIVL